MTRVAVFAPTEAVGENFRSRGGAAVIVVALHAALLLLMTVSLHRIVEPQFPTVEPILTRLIEEPRAQHQDADPLALRPRILKPALHLADVPPNVHVNLPTDTGPAAQANEVPASLISGQAKDQGDSSPQGNSNGAGLSAGPRVLHQVAPIYSAASVRAHEQGTVTLRVLVDAHGAPNQIRIAGSSGFARLDRSATDAVQRYRFSPPAHELEAQGSWTTVQVGFDLLPMPVPTSIVAFDPVSAAQIAAAQRNPVPLTPEIMKTDAQLRTLADHLFDTLTHHGAAMAAASRDPSKPTPAQLLARQGNLKSVRFLGFTSDGFSCGNSDRSVNATAGRCEVFEVQQVAGITFWLVLVADHGTTIKNISIATSANPLRNGNAQP